MSGQEEGGMERRPLGATGMWVSLLGLGTVKLGRRRGLKYPGAATGEVSLPEDAKVEELFRAAAELGINVIDTAPAYGVSEERIGEMMARLGWLGGREKWVVCTKAGEEFDDEKGESRFDFSAGAIRTSVERSLRRLRTERVEVVLLHSDGRDEWIVRESGAMEELERLRERGLVRAIGVSTKSVAGGLAAVERMKSSGVVMVTYNRTERGEEVVIDAAARGGVGVLVKKALESGHAGDAGESLRFVTRHPGVSSVIVGTISVAHLDMNTEALALG